jgi:plastocyanin
MIRARHGRRRPIAIVLALALLLPASAALGQATATVVIDDELEPARLAIVPGTTVTWRNEDGERHRMRSQGGPADFDSGNLEPGETYAFTFTLEGTYPYLDEREDDDVRYHGTIVVSGAGVASSPGALLSSAAVSLVDEEFVPSSIEVATGGTVTWSNDDGDDTHTVTADDGSFSSDVLEGGATYSHTFTEAGTFPYACLIHPEMRGTVVVPGPAVAVSPGATIDASASPAATTSPAPVTSAVPTSSLAPLASAVPAPSPALSAVGSSPPADPSAATDVSLAGRAFQPADVTVPAGSAVRWLNDDTGGHTVTAVDGSFDSGVLTVGSDFTEVFEAAGSFDYFCAIHPEMRGTVTVTE